MPSTNSQDPSHPTTPPQSIPLRDLSRPPDSTDLGDGGRRQSRGRILLGGASRPTSSGHGYGPRYERLGDTSPSPTQRTPFRAGGLPSLGLQVSPPVIDEHGTPTSPVDNPAEFQAAMGFAGLNIPDISLSAAPRTRASHGSDYYNGMTPYADGGDDQPSYFNMHSDQARLTDPANLQPFGGVEPSTPSGQRHDRPRSSFHSVSFDTPGQSGSRLGDDLRDAEAGNSPRGSRNRSHSYGAPLTPDGRDRSKSPSTAFSRAGSIVRAMSQRVVNLSGEAELIEASARREAAASSSVSSLSDESETRYQPKHKSDPLGAGPNYRPDLPTAPIEKALRFFGGMQPAASEEAEPEKPPNPLKGKSLGIFSAKNKIRNRLCDFLVYPLTEPAILLLIMVQTVLLAIDSSRSVYEYPRSDTWGQNPIDYALLGLFILFTLEIVARVIVSGFIFNAPEYGRATGRRGLKAAVADKYRAVFKPQRQSSLREPSTAAPDALRAPTILRSFTAKQGEAIRTVEQAQRLQLARRAFLRHSFNRLDFLAVVSFWIAFVLGILGIEKGYHLYAFRMLSCLRIIRLLALTHGTSVSDMTLRLVQLD